MQNGQECLQYTKRWFLRFTIQNSVVLSLLFLVLFSPFIIPLYVLARSQKPARNTKKLPDEFQIHHFTKFVPKNFVPKFQIHHQIRPYFSIHH